MSSDEEEYEMAINCPSSIGPYKMHGVIGDGAFSQVRLCQDQRSGQYYACKIVPQARLDTTHLVTRFEIEIRINQQLHHPGVVQMIDLFMDEENYYVIMEFCPNGDLFQYVVDRTKLSENEAKPIFRQILETISYLHKMGVSHRDLKPENILIDQYGHIKISDFGLSRFIGKNGLVETPCGSPCYASPECISGRPYNGITTDIWSCGVILFAMVTGQLPWTKRNQNQLFQQIKRGEYSVPSYISKEGKNMITKLMTVNIEQRYTVEQALNDPWLAKIPQQLLLTDQKGYVSMRQVDQYFNREISTLDLSNLVEPSKSFSELDPTILVKRITEEGYSSTESDGKRKSKHKSKRDSSLDKKRKHHKKNGTLLEDKKKKKKKSKKEKDEFESADTDEFDQVDFNPIRRPGSRRRNGFRPNSEKIMPNAYSTKPR